MQIIARNAPFRELPPGHAAARHAHGRRGRKAVGGGPGNGDSLARIDRDRQARASLTRSSRDNFAGEPVPPSEAGHDVYRRGPVAVRESAHLPTIGAGSQSDRGLGCSYSSTDRVGARERRLGFNPEFVAVGGRRRLPGKGGIPGWQRGRADGGQRPRPVAGRDCHDEPRRGRAFSPPPRHPPPRR